VSNPSLPERRPRCLSVNEPAVFPDFDTGTDARRLEPASELNRDFVGIALKLPRGVDVAAVIDEESIVAGHRSIFRRLSFEGRSHILGQQVGETQDYDHTHQHLAHGGDPSAQLATAQGGPACLTNDESTPGPGKERASPFGVSPSFAEDRDTASLATANDDGVTLEDWGANRAGRVPGGFCVSV
jgi:hypothetical protein